MSKIAFIKSDDRKYNIQRTLSLIKSEIILGIKNAKKIVIKPNCVVTNYQLAATHKDALDALLEIITPYTDSQITLAEGSGMGETIEGFKNYGYFSLQDKYGFSVVDLNNDDSYVIPLYDRKGKKWPARIAKTICDSDYLISVCPPKTHNEVIFTGGIKNVTVGALTRPSGNFASRVATKFGISTNNKAMIHQGYHAINQNIAEIYKRVKINLSIIDGFEAMQGDGPGLNGEIIPGHWAISSSSALSADVMALKLMGINFSDVGYINMIAGDQNLEEPFIIGDNWSDSIRKFKMHSTFEKQKNWRK